MPTCSSLQLPTRISKTLRNKWQNGNPSVAKPVVLKLETQSSESALFTTTIWKDRLQDKLADRLFWLQKIWKQTINENESQQKYTKRTQGFYAIMLTEVHNMIAT